MRRLSLFALLAVAGVAPAQTLKSGTVITKSVKLKEGEYLVPAPGDENGSGAILVKGDNLTVDFNGAVLRGTPTATDPDGRTGVGLQIEGRNVTIKNARISGYKIGLIARNSPGLKILDSDLSYNWKQRLLSTDEREDLADWMSYHQNEKDEWLRYGAAMYLRGCDGFEVRNVKAIGAQNGLMLTSCNRGLVWNNDFSFNSALALGMYRSSDNRIMHNRMDWSVRGFSYGVYNRGQDSAGILIYEQSNRNTFAYNSVTHSGDGFFLWAGQTTMDTGKGGCNDNLLYGNDWSHAPTNGIEATFSRNTFANNLILECWHGVWGGYSYDTKIVGNVFGYNAEGIALEHGQNNAIDGNLFFRDSTAIHLWMNERQDPNWGYAKLRDTKSHGYRITGNLFSNVTQGGSPDPGTALQIKATSDVLFGPNRFGPVGRVYDVRGPMTNFNFVGSDGYSSLKVDSLGTGFAAAVEGSASLPGKPQGILPPAASLTAGKVFTDPAEYRSRFLTNWNPLRNGANEPISVGLGRGLGTIPAAARSLAPKPLKGGIDPFLKRDALRGWRYIIVDQWGPYDFRRPILWPREETNGKRRFEILGPTGQWRVASVKGGSVSAQSGTVPGWVDIQTVPGKATNLDVQLEYTGGKTVDYRGIETPAGKPVRFGYTKFFAPIAWDVKFYTWTKSVNAADPIAIPDAEHYKQVIAGQPVHTMKTDRLDFASGGAFYRGGPADKFVTIADGEFDIDPGKYTLDVTTDDGMRVWVDGKLVIDSWQYQGPTPYNATLLLGGHHRIRVEHFEIGGYSALKVALTPARP